MYITRRYVVRRNGNSPTRRILSRIFRGCNPEIRVAVWRLRKSRDYDMAVPSEDLVRQVLADRDRNRIIRSSILSAWREVRATYPQVSWFRRKTTIRGLMWEHAVSNLIDGLSADRGIHVQRHLDTISFVFDEIVLLRVKKANVELRTCNYPTELAGLFYEHQIELFGFPGVQRVEAAYVLNRFETEVDWVGIVAWGGGRQLWHFEIEEVPTIRSISSLQQPVRRPTSQLAKPKRTGIGREVRSKKHHGGE